MLPTIIAFVWVIKRAALLVRGRVAILVALAPSAAGVGVGVALAGVIVVESVIRGGAVIGLDVGTVMLGVSADALVCQSDG